MSAALPLPWQTSQWATLQNAQQRGALNHAWLLAGPAGVGKRRFAAAFTASLLCTAPQQGMACGHCPACSRLAQGGHPDAHLLGLNGHQGLSSLGPLSRPDALTHWQPRKDSARQEIAVDAVRSLLNKLSTTAHSGGNRVVVVYPASDMSDATANALLKTVEEPAPNTYVLFVTEYPLSLKQTLRSRCQQLRFPVPERGVALSWLFKQAEQADATLLDAAGGAPLAALQWLSSGELARRQRWQTLLAQVAARKADALATAAELAKDKGDTPALLRYWQTELLARLRAAPQHWGSQHERFLALLLENLRALENTNANAQLLLENLLLRWRLLG